VFEAGGAEGIRTSDLHEAGARSPDGGAASGSARLDSEGPPPHRRLLPPTLCFPPVRVIFAFVLIGLRCIRIPIEEKALRAGLEGYDDGVVKVTAVRRLVGHTPSFK
jgi:hypothetical protein